MLYNLKKDYINKDKIEYYNYKENIIIDISSKGDWMGDHPPRLESIYQ